MHKKIMSLLLSVLMFCSLIIPVSAGSIAFVADNAGLLAPEEIAVLEEKAAELELFYGIHAVVLTVDSLGGSRPQDYADEYYDNAGYGEDGVLFLLAMEEREWYISTCGSMFYALTDYGIEQIGTDVIPFLSEGLWYDGFCCFMDSLPVYLDAYASGSPIEGYADYSGDYYHGDQEEFTPNILLSLLCGIVVAGIVVFCMRRSMNTKRAQRSAGEYINEGSWSLTQHTDLFLYSNVTKTRKQDPPEPSGGGSSVHRSSSGRRHGGGGGKF